MMNGIAYELQVALLKRLKEDPRIVAAGIPVYDAIPNGSSLPYISIDEFRFMPYKSKTFDGLQLTATLSTLSEASGKAEVLKILAYIRAALKEPLTLREGHVVDLQEEDASRLIEVDDLEVVTTPVKHGVIDYRFSIKEGGQTT